MARHHMSPPVYREDFKMWAFIPAYCVQCHVKWPCPLEKALAVESYRHETYAEMVGALRG